jgi:hypothetical protein
MHERFRRTRLAVLLLGALLLAPRSNAADPPLLDELLKPEHVEMTIKFIFDAPKEIGPKSRVDIGAIYGRLVGPGHPDVVLKDVEVVSLDRAKQTATLRIKKDDEPALRRAINECSLYIRPHGCAERKTIKP